MNQLDVFNQLAENVREEQQAPVKQEYRLAGRVTIKKNQQLYSLHLKTGVVALVPVDLAVGYMNKGGEIVTKRRAVFDPNVIYYAAYNIAQAETHFKKVIKKYLLNLNK